jgi:hypothetical protein
MEWTSYIDRPCLEGMVIVWRFDLWETSRPWCMQWCNLSDSSYLTTQKIINGWSKYILRASSEILRHSVKKHLPSYTRQSPALGNELVYRVQDTRHRNTLDKDVFAEWRTLGKGGARQKAVSGRLKLTAVSLCRGLKAGTRQRGFFAECQISDTRQRSLYRVSSLDIWQSMFYFFNFGNQTFCGMFLHYVGLHVLFLEQL